MSIPLICIAYFSGFGHTARLAREIATGAKGATVLSVDVTQMTAQDWDNLDRADTIVFGAPTYMGSTAAQFGLFLEEAATRWEHGVWQDKLAAGFTVAVHPSGDKLAALQRLSIFAAQMGMIWVGQAETGAPVHPDRGGVNHDGAWLGLTATEQMGTEHDLSEADLETARRFGLRLATASQRWRKGRA